MATQSEVVTMPVTTWVAVEGLWKFSDGSAKYLGPRPDSPFPYGIALGQARIRGGTIETTVHLHDEPTKANGRVIFGCHPMTREYFAAGVGGYDLAYVVDAFVPGVGWRAIGATGSSENFSPGAQFRIRIAIRGQHVVLAVDDIEVVEVNLPKPLSGDQVGLFAWGNAPVEFTATAFTAMQPVAFVVMQFGEPYDTFYEEVIRPVAKEKHLDPQRADEIRKPGLILQDVVNGIVEAELVIAEITPSQERGFNPNVFYELGYAHALGKPTVLLVREGTPLPFDISGYRCILYEDSIGGKKRVETELRIHLENILRER